MCKLVNHSSRSCFSITGQFLLGVHPEFLILSKSTLIALLLRHLRPSMLQQLLRRLVFDVPQLTEYCKIPIKVSL